MAHAHLTSPRRVVSDIVFFCISILYERYILGTANSEHVSQHGSRGPGRGRVERLQATPLAADDRWALTRRRRARHQDHAMIVGHNHKPAARITQDSAATTGRGTAQRRDRPRRETETGTDTTDDTRLHMIRPSGKGQTVYRSSKRRRSAAARGAGNSRRSSAARGLWLLARSLDGEAAPSSSVSTGRREPSSIAIEEAHCVGRMGQCLRANASSGLCKSSHWWAFSDTSWRWSGREPGDSSAEPRRFAHRLPAAAGGGVWGGIVECSFESRRCCMLGCGC